MHSHFVGFVMRRFIYYKTCSERCLKYCLRNNIIHYTAIDALCPLFKEFFFSQILSGVCNNGDTLSRASNLNKNKDTGEKRHSEYKGKFHVVLSLPIPMKSFSKIIIGSVGVPSFIVASN